MPDHRIWSANARFVEFIEPPVDEHAGSIVAVTDSEMLRPIERRMASLAASGVGVAEIGTRFNRSGAFVERVLNFAELPGRRAPLVRPGLRPLEQRLLRWRAEGALPQDLAPRFRRSPEHIQRVLVLADHKRSRGADTQR